MMDIKDFYILGLPIETDIGICDFIKVKDYPDYSYDLQVMSWSKLQVIYEYSKINKNGQLDELISQLKEMTLFEIVANLPDLRYSYYKVMTKVFNNEDSLEKITIENFDYFRNLILKMNCATEDEVNPNPEIQAFIEKSKRAKRLENEKLEFADLITSVSVYCGFTYDYINNLTIYQLYSTFHRIGRFKNYDTSTLFATVSSEKINIDSWCKHINLFEKESHSISHDKFKKTTGSLFNE